MPRNKRFHSKSRTPLDSNPSLELDDASPKGSLFFLNPTRARFRYTAPSWRQSADGSVASTKTADGAESKSEDELGAALREPNGKTHHGAAEKRARTARLEAGAKDIPASNVSFQWRSRDNRKGRHTLVVTPSPSGTYLVPEPSNSMRAVLRGILAMLTTFPFYDISWLVAVLFTLGSVVWVINAFFVWLPLVRPETEFSGEIDVGGGWTAFIGATIFEIGSVFLMIEAVNENREGCFGWAVEHVFADAEGGGKQEFVKLQPQAKACIHHHTNRSNLVGSAAPGNGVLEGDDGRDENSQSDKGDSCRGDWQWFPTWHDLTTHYIYELGFLACAAQFFGATVFWIAGFSSLPELFDALSSESQASLNLGYWIPQVVGGSGFITSGMLFMLETQSHWYIPAPKVLGWWIGLFNLIGAFGFTLCGALGMAYANPGAEFEANLATYWGSWAFLIGSVVQWYESLDKHPVEKQHAVDKI